MGEAWPKNTGCCLRIILRHTSQSDQLERRPLLPIPEGSFLKKVLISSLVSFFTLAPILDIAGSLLLGGGISKGGAPYSLPRSGISVWSDIHIGYIQNNKDEGHYLDSRKTGNITKRLDSFGINL